MRQYLEISFQAVVFFPFVVALFTLPYMIYNYHKFGSVRSLKIVIVYSFIFYLMCMYCLVVLPFPSPEEAMKLHGHKMQLVPFLFVHDIIKKSHIEPGNIKSLITLVYNKAFMVNIFNLFLALPFGVYLRYYFRRNALQTFFWSFLLSLFFEITQLTGFYFLYPGSYRLFDVDDLIINTLGGMLGYVLTGPFLAFLPSRQELDAISYRRGEHITIFRRMVAFGFDIFIMAAIYVVLFIFMDLANISLPYLNLWLPVLCFGSFAVLLGGRTPGKFLTSTRIVSLNGETAKIYQYFFRYAFMFWGYFILPGYIRRYLENMIQTNVDESMDLILVTAEMGLTLFFLLFLLISFIGMLRHKPLFYERWSKTKVISTVKVKSL